MKTICNWNNVDFHWNMDFCTGIYADMWNQQLQNNESEQSNISSDASQTDRDFGAGFRHRHH